MTNVDNLPQRMVKLGIYRDNVMFGLGVTEGVRLKSSGEQGGDTFKTPSPTNNFCLYPPPVLRCFWKDPLMTPTPTTPLQASFTATPSPSTTPAPHKNFDHAQESYHNFVRLWLYNSLLILLSFLQFREDSQIDFVMRNIPWMFRGKMVLSWMFLLSQETSTFEDQWVMKNECISSLPAP